MAQGLGQAKALPLGQPIGLKTLALVQGYFALTGNGAAVAQGVGLKPASLASSRKFVLV